jgi:5-methylcytosine-specific restriction protein B
MSDSVALPAEVDAAFGEGTWNGGTGAHTLLWRWLASAVEFVQAFWAEPEETRRQALADPWAWQQVIHRHITYPSLRESLKYLAFPGHFLPIIKRQHKLRIREAFASQFAANTGDLDRDLLGITLGLQAAAGGPVDYYRSPFVQQWLIATPPGDRRAWLVRPGPAGPTQVRRWRTEGFVSLVGDHLGDIAPDADRATVQAAVEAGYQHVDYVQRMALTNEFHAFLSKMEVDDIVVSTVDDQLILGVIIGDATYDPDADGEQLRRDVRWERTTGDVDALPAPLSSLLDQQGAVVDLTSAVGVLATLLNPADGQAPQTPTSPATVTPPPPPPGSPPLRAVTPELAASLHMSAEWLQDLVDLLAERQQIILYGPPGTGKTYLAQAIARHITQRDAIRLVQFHPSYSYEDFFEGFRPRESADGTALGFAKTAGPLRELAADARTRPEVPHVLIIDEINRGNLAKVFGELYFLLEYRNASIRLQYSPSEPFSLPSNIFIIGTMNTADRTIALVDTAIRRRFAFVELHPDEEPVRDLLARWLAARGESPERAELLRALNEAIGPEDRDFKIGPSYLMRPDLDKPGRLERVWRHDILPTLEEHYFGRYSREQVHERFGLAAIRRRLRASESPDQP